MLVLLVVYYDEASKQKAHEIAKRHPCMVPILLPNENNIYFESYVYMFYDTLVKPVLPEGTTHIGTVSYCMDSKISMKALSYVLETKAYEQFDFVHLKAVDSRVSQSRCHPTLVSLWNKHIGVPEDAEEGFYNFWISTKEFFETYSKYLQTELVPKLLEDPETFADSTYVGKLSKENLLRLTGYSYYITLPFLLERVPRYYAKKNKFSCGKVI